MTTTTERVHAAYIDDDRRYWFVSLDGETWLECSEDPTPYPIEAVREVFNPRKANGFIKGFLPMRIARGFIRQRGAVFV